MVNCPVVQKLAELTPEYYEAEGVNIVIDVLEEENLRTKEMCIRDRSMEVRLKAHYEVDGEKKEARAAAQISVNEKGRGILVLSLIHISRGFPSAAVSQRRPVSRERTAEST